MRVLPTCNVGCFDANHLTAENDVAFRMKTKKRPGPGAVLAALLTIVLGSSKRCLFIDQGIIRVFGVAVMYISTKIRAGTLRKFPVYVRTGAKAASLITQ